MTNEEKIQHIIKTEAVLAFDKMMFVNSFHYEEDGLKVRISPLDIQTRTDKKTKEVQYFLKGNEIKTTVHHTTVL